MSEHDNNHDANDRQPHEASAESVSTAEAIEASAEERHTAQRLAEALDALERGRSGLDELPKPAAYPEIVDLVTMGHALRSAGPEGGLSGARQDALWADIEARTFRRGTRIRARRRSSWWAAGLALVGAAVAAVGLLVLGQQLVHEAPAVLPMPPRAVAQLDEDLPRYAAQMMAADADPSGDTRLRDLRRARFDAWRTDATWHRRHGARRGAR